LQSESGPYALQVQKENFIKRKRETAREERVDVLLCKRRWRPAPIFSHRRWQWHTM